MSNIEKKTVNEKELETLAFWQSNNIFEKTSEQTEGGIQKESFSFYDGPPFATGLPHHGHLLAGTIKDAIPRYMTMNGKYVRRVWGWDCHGLPLENIIEKKLNLKNKKDIEEYGIKNFNEAARSTVFEYESKWKEVVPRMGRFVDMENSYKTMDATYTESIWWSFKNLHEKGLVFEGYKIMYICPRCETSLAQSEVNMPGAYQDVTDISVTVKLELEDEPDTYLLAWTTTPWTLPGNVAAAVNSEAEYVYIGLKKEGEEKNIYVLAKERIAKNIKDEYEILKEVSGADLVGKKYKPVFEYFKDVEMPNKENIWKVVHADFVTMDTGTGIVHEAPAFGTDDYNLAKTENLPIIKHVKMDGSFTAEVADFQGLLVKQKRDTQSTDIEIIKKLAHTGKLFSKEKIIHSYPHCWRCDTPLLNYATSSWFMNVPKIKSELLSENQKISWVPEHIKNGRFGKWKENEHEWALSRSRYWGAPLPVWKCTDCGEVDIFGSIDDLQTRLKANNEYFVMRHGQSISNTEDRADSGKDQNNHLTEKGREQVIEGAKNFKEKIDIIIASPILRTKETAEIVAKELGVSEIVFDDRLVEFNFAAFDGQKFSDFFSKINYTRANFDKKVEGGEGYRDVQRRVLAAVFAAEEKYAGKKILFVTHGAPMWMMLTATQHMSDKQALEYRESKKGNGNFYFLPNASMLPLDFKPFPHSEFGLDFHRPYIDEVKYSCVCGGEKKRIADVFDCWYESGSMPFAQFHYPFENKDLFEKTFPADFIAEGLDQTRGWFNSLINLGVGLFGKSSYKNVIVNGLTMAGDGQKMSKSKQNYTDPLLLVEKYGADAFRYSLLSSPLMRGENIPFPDSLVDDVYKKLILRLENVYSFYKMYEEEGIKPKDTSENILDIWILSLLNRLKKTITESMDKYELDSATRPINDFIDDLSTWYLRRSRERMKGDFGEREKELAVSTLAFVLTDFTKLIAPFMPFIAERIYLGIDPQKESVHLEKWPEIGNIDEINLVQMKEIRDIVSAGLEARIKANIKVRQPLNSLTIKEVDSFNTGYLNLLKEELNVKNIFENSAQIEKVILDLEITPVLKKEGDLRELIRSIKDMRKEKGLTQKDETTLCFMGDDTVISFMKESKDFLQKECSLTDLVLEENLENSFKIGEMSMGLTLK